MGDRESPPPNFATADLRVGNKQSFLQQAGGGGGEWGWERGMYI